jgi:hypothetical protein
VSVVVFDVQKVAVPADTAVFGFQFVAVSKSFDPGVASQVASCAHDGLETANAANVAAAMMAVRGTMRRYEDVFGMIGKIVRFLSPFGAMKRTIFAGLYRFPIQCSIALNR